MLLAEQCEPGRQGQAERGLWVSCWKGFASSQVPANLEVGRQVLCGLKL